MILFLLACTDPTPIDTDTPTLSAEAGGLTITPPPLHTGHTAETADPCPQSGYISGVESIAHDGGVMVLIRGIGEICDTLSGPPGAESPCWVAEHNLASPAKVRIKPDNSLFCEITTTAGVVRWTP